MGSVPFRPEDITSEWLSEVTGTKVSSFDIEQIGIGVGLLGRLYRITLTGNGGPSAVIAKFPTLDEGARMNVIEPLRFYEKEISFYKQSASSPVATPRVHCAEFDRDSGDFVLLLEDCGGRRMADQITGCTVEDAEVAVDALVALHSHFWNSDFSTMPWLPSYADPPFPQVLTGMFKQAWPRAVEVLGELMSPEIRDFGERWPDLVPWFMDELTKPPHTFVHGDYRLDNLFFKTKDEHAPVTIVDWQISFRGRGGYDIGYFLSQSLTTEDRRANQDALIKRYADGMAAKGIDYPDDELDADYRRTIAWCFAYPVNAAGQIEVTNDRMLQLVQGMYDRAVAAIEDTKALELLP